MMMKATLFVVLALVAQGALAHTYFRAELSPAPAGHGKEAATGSGLFEFMTHSGIAYYTLNVTDVQGMAAAQLVFGDASLSYDPVVAFLEVEPLNGTFFTEGSFSADNFTESYPWSMNGLQANIGLDHIWATVNNNASYANTLLLGQVLQVTPEEIVSEYVLSL